MEDLFETSPGQIHIAGLEYLADFRLFEKHRQKLRVADVVADLCDVFSCLIQRSLSFFNVPALAFDCADRDQDPPK